jgi:hypothetical protein
MPHNNLRITPKGNGMFYLIGAAHRAHLIEQSGQRTDAHEAFSKCLRSAIADHRPVLTAEEANTKKLTEYKQVSLTKTISDAEGIEHMFCDPGDSERDEMDYMDRSAIGLELTREWNVLSSAELDAKAGAIEIARFFPMREQFWLNRLSKFREQGVVFVCGDFHVDRFAKLLGQAGIPNEILQRDIGVIEEDARRMDIAVK